MASVIRQLSAKILGGSAPGTPRAPTTPMSGHTPGATPGATTASTVITPAVTPGATSGATPPSPVITPGATTGSHLTSPVVTPGVTPGSTPGAHSTPTVLGTPTAHFAPLLSPLAPGRPKTIFNIISPSPTGAAPALSPTTITRFNIRAPNGKFYMDYTGHKVLHLSDIWGRKGLLEHIVGLDSDAVVEVGKGRNHGPFIFVVGFSKKKMRKNKNRAKDAAIEAARRQQEEDKEEQRQNELFNEQEDLKDADRTEAVAISDKFDVMEMVAGYQDPDTNKEKVNRLRENKRQKKEKRLRE